MFLCMLCDFRIFNGSVKFRILVCHVLFIHNMHLFKINFYFLQTVGRTVGSSTKCKTERGCSGYYNSTFNTTASCSHHWTLWHRQNIHSRSGRKAHAPAAGDEVRWGCVCSDLISRAWPLSLLWIQSEG